MLGLRVVAWGSSPETINFHPLFIPPKNMPTARPPRGRSGLWRRRAVRAPVGDAVAPLRRGTRSTDGGRRAGRLSATTGSCLRAMGGTAAQGACAACAALARLWRRVSTTRDRPLRQSHTAPHRPADASRFVPIAGGENELALLCATAQGTLPASGKARCARCARRDGLGAPLGSPAPHRRARPTRRVRADRRQ